LDKLVAEGKFRQDLYYRINVMRIDSPALQEHPEDVPKIARHFLRHYSQVFQKPMADIEPDALAMLQNYSWPGNVRELENVVRKALLLAQGYTINADQVRAALNKDTDLAGSARRPLGEYVDDLLAAAQRGELTDVHARVLESVERELFRRAIELARGNQAKAARWLGISRITMKAKLLQFGFHPGTENDQGV
jgi:DNA-binding NtrC family response regulator